MHLFIDASKGIARGRAWVIDAWQPDPDIKPGEILVANNAGPLWLPHFPILAGLVLEIVP